MSGGFVVGYLEGHVDVSGDWIGVSFAFWPRSFLEKAWMEVMADVVVRVVRMWEPCWLDVSGCFFVWLPFV